MSIDIREHGGSFGGGGYRKGDFLSSKEVTANAPVSTTFALSNVHNQPTRYRDQIATLNKICVSGLLTSSTNYLVILAYDQTTNTFSEITRFDLNNEVGLPNIQAFLTDSASNVYYHENGGKLVKYNSAKELQYNVTIPRIRDTNSWGFGDNEDFIYSIAATFYFFKIDVTTGAYTQFDVYEGNAYYQYGIVFDRNLGLCWTYGSGGHIIEVDYRNMVKKRAVLISSDTSLTKMVRLGNLILTCHGSKTILTKADGTNLSVVKSYTHPTSVQPADAIANEAEGLFYVSMNTKDVYVFDTDLNLKQIYKPDVNTEFEYVRAATQDGKYLVSSRVNSTSPAATVTHKLGYTLS